MGVSGQFELFDGRTGSHLWTAATDGHPVAVAVSRDGRHLVTFAERGSAFVFWRSVRGQAARAGGLRHGWQAARALGELPRWRLRRGVRRGAARGAVGEGLGHPQRPVVGGGGCPCASRPLGPRALPRRGGPGALVGAVGPSLNAPQLRASRRQRSFSDCVAVWSVGVRVWCGSLPSESRASETDATPCKWRTTVQKLQTATASTASRQRASYAVRKATTPP